MTERVLVAGYYGSGNTGDEAILTALLRDLRALRPTLEFTVVSANPPDTSARHGVRSLHERDIPALIDAAVESDLVLVGGGGVFHDYWGCDEGAVLSRRHAGIPFYAGFPLLAACAGRPSMIYATGVGPLYSDEGRRLTRRAFEHATVATVRDAASRDVLEGLGVTGVTVTADPAFRVRGDLAGARAVLDSVVPLGARPLIGVSVRGWMASDATGPWEAELARALDGFIDATGAIAVFVPFQAHGPDFLTDDVAAAQRVIDRLSRPARSVSLRDVSDPEIIAGVVASCDLVVGMRLHSLVFAATAGIPAVALAYDPKVASLMARVGLDAYVVPLDAAAGLGDRLSAAWARRDAIRADLPRRLPALQALATHNARLAVGLLDESSRRPARAPGVEWLSAFALRQTRRVAEQEAAIDDLVTSQAEQLARVSAEADALAGEVAVFRSSKVWQVAEGLRRARRRLAPPGTRRDHAVRLAVRATIAVVDDGLSTSLAAGGRNAWRGLRHWLFMPRGLWALDYRPPGDPTVVLYSDHDDLFPEHRPRRGPAASRDRRVTVSLIATARNERASVATWLASVAAQSRVPDEIVVVDGGSSDGTPDVLEAEAMRLGLDLKVFVEPHANIARGRNLAIERARGDVLACTDLGCRLTPAWLERIVAPFEADEAVQVAAGWYVTLEDGRPARRRRWPRLDEVDPAVFVPSSRSIAFTREAWATVGGYPEWLTLTGEDTWFALELRRFCDHWAFVPEAEVEWDTPSSMAGYWRKIYSWSVGDGESGVGGPLYWRSFRRLAAVIVGATAGAGTVVATAAGIGPGVALVLLGVFTAAVAAAVRRRRASLGSLNAIVWEVGAEAARVMGFVRGAARRRQVIARRHGGTRGLAMIMSGVPIDDTGGGARCTQLALELLKQNWYVVFVSRFPRYESANLGLKIRHRRLFTVSFDGFAWRRFLRDHADLLRTRPAMTVVEFPLADFLPLIQAIRRAGGSVVYDLLDDWDSTLGREWYSTGVERKIIARSDVLTATAKPLAARLTAMSRRDVVLLPNAVNTDLFDPAQPWPRPADFPSEAAWSMIYIGALWGDWFDWPLLGRLAAVYPEAAVVVIGDYRDQMRRVPGNLHFLGLKPQAMLPAYLTHADVAIVPWKINAVTHATSPLKVYEYLAMRRPVVAPKLDALVGIPGVLLSPDADAFVDNVARARQTRVDAAVIDAFVCENSWTARVRTLLESVGRDDA